VHWGAPAGKRGRANICLHSNSAYRPHGGRVRVHRYTDRTHHMGRAMCEVHGHGSHCSLSLLSLHAACCLESYAPVTVIQLQNSQDVGDEEEKLAGVARGCAIDARAEVQARRRRRCIQLRANIPWIPDSPREYLSCSRTASFQALITMFAVISFAAPRTCTRCRTSGKQRAQGGQAQEMSGGHVHHQGSPNRLALRPSCPRHARYRLRDVGGR
jgi:hypothetical protein